MNSIAATLDRVGDDLASVVGELFAGDVARGLSETDVLEVMAAGARIVRAGEALLVEATTQACDRSDGRLHADRMTTRFGCRSVGELVQRVTRVSKQRAGDLARAARAVVRPVALTTGGLLPAALPHMREALAAAEVGVDGVVAVAGPLLTCGAGTAAILAADEEIAATARGEGADAAPPPCAEDLRAMAMVWAMYLDQDGAEPKEQRALRKRGITIGPCRDGLHPVRGNVLPEVAAQMQRAFDSVLNPKLDGPPAPGRPFFSDSRGATETVDPDDPDAPLTATADDRTRAQKQHDALATVLTVVAGAGALPTLGGAAPTLVVSVRQEDLATGRGFAHIDGSDEPISLASARHIACSGAVQRVIFDDSGQIVQLGSRERAFNHHQRRGIGLRDGGCIIPGCHVRADWCEIHHVQEHARGGPTHIDNGVLLCWFHHRTLDSSGWAVRMNHGIPEVRGPYWWDSRVKWRPVTKSPTRMRERVGRRT
ncbi:HNH endonuclease signature motif containing protein [Microbacterium sp.]|uniref:HNH endonuclease signature motif containing protein n=1 Tax=Microbacterium sp. TaxID=51671 RepID=UPI002E31DD97|nr:DUF222 domain-containing protein [Microbacterium sp.]HEX5728068.1 DUF222 domain-containing protein [Microbacterium sp.]